MNNRTAPPECISNRPTARECIFIRTIDIQSGAIPTGCVSLSAAREKLLKAMTPNLATINDEIHRCEQIVAAKPGDNDADSRLAAAHSAYEHATEDADCKLRLALCTGELVGRSLDLRCDQVEWDRKEWKLDQWNTENFGFSGDFVAPGAPNASGPDTRFGQGKHWPIFFLEAQFIKWLDGTYPADGTDAQPPDIVNNDVPVISPLPAKNSPQSRAAFEAMKLCWPRGVPSDRPTASILRAVNLTIKAKLSRKDYPFVIVSAEVIAKLLGRRK